MAAAFRPRTLSIRATPPIRATSPIGATLRVARVLSGTQASLR
jgi:hypothetical protein